MRIRVKVSVRHWVRERVRVWVRVRSRLGVGIELGFEQSKKIRDFVTAGRMIDNNNALIWVKFMYFWIRPGTNS